MEIDSETTPSPPSAVQRETTIIPVNAVIPVDPIAQVDPADLVDIPRHIPVGHKRPAWAQKKSARGRGTCNPSRHIPRKQETKDIFELCFSHDPHH
jgi:hypothetical protein